jgi:tripartite-type tricarboxylate transporter receptor subunit TctC
MQKESIRGALPRRVAALVGIACIVMAGVASAQSAAGSGAFPARPLRLLVPFSPGGSSDALARGIGKFMSDDLGQPVVVENRPGAGGMIAAEAVARAPADGYTLLFGTIGTHGIAPALYRKLAFDPVKDLAPISLLHQHPNVLMVHPSVKATSVAELIALAKTQPGRLTFASAGNGSVSHLAGEIFKSMTGIEIVHVPYKGGGAAMPDLLSGQVSMMFETITNALPMTRSGKLRGLGVTSLKPWGAAPELPTIAATGLPGYEVNSWTGMLTTAGTPRAAIDRINLSLVRASRDAAYRDNMLNALGVEAIASTPEQFAGFIAAEVAKWGRAISASGTRLD